MKLRIVGIAHWLIFSSCIVVRSVRIDKFILKEGESRMVSIMFMVTTCDADISI